MRYFVLVFFIIIGLIESSILLTSDKQKKAKNLAAYWGLLVPGLVIMLLFAMDVEIISVGEWIEWGMSNLFGFRRK